VRADVLLVHTARLSTKHEICQKGKFGFNLRWESEKLYLRLKLMEQSERKSVASCQKYQFFKNYM